MGTASHEVLREAAARLRSAVISLPKAKGFEHHKTRFLAEDAEGVWLQSVPGAAKLIDEIVVMQARVAVAFKAGPHKAVFASPIVRRDANFTVAGSVSADAILLAMPEQVEGVQRRGVYRVDVVPAAECGDLSARVWRVSESFPQSERPAPEDELSISIRDMSISGIGLYCAAENGQPVAIPAEQKLRIWLGFKGIELYTDGRVRHVQVIPQQITRAGVLLLPWDQAEIEKQRMSRMEKIVGALRREEMRRMRGQLLSGAKAHSPAA